MNVWFLWYVTLYRLEIKIHHYYTAAAVTYALYQWIGICRSFQDVF